MVDTGGVPGIRVRQENRDVGRTDSRGRFLVPDLRSFEINQLSIEPLDAPITADVPLTRREVRPQDRSGVIVRLPVTNKRSALVRLVDPGGKPIRVGSFATLIPPALRFLSAMTVKPIWSIFRTVTKSLSSSPIAGAAS